MTINDLLNKMIGKKDLIIHVDDAIHNISDYYDLDEIVTLYECEVLDWRLNLTNNHLQIYI